MAFGSDDGGDVVFEDGVSGDADDAIFYLLTDNVSVYVKMVATHATDCILLLKGSEVLLI